MTVALEPQEVAAVISERFPSAVVATGENRILLRAESLREVACFLRDSPELAFDYLNFLTAADYYDYFEVIYMLTSLKHNHSIVLKVHCQGRERPSVPSVYDVWLSADYQERETYDLMGIVFEGHPNLRRLVLWEGFEGHPLRKDYL